MKDILEKLALLESEKPKAALLNKKFSSFRDMEQLQGDAKITTAHKPVKMGDKQKGLTGKLVGTSEAVETTVEDLVAQLGSEFKSQFLGDKKKPKKDRDLANAPADREIGKKKPANDIHVKENEVAEGLGDDEHRAFKRQELRHELGHEKNNIQVVINGKPWKVFAGKGYADSPEEYRHLQSMKAWAQKKSAATGKKWDVYLTGAPASANEGVAEGAGNIGAQIKAAYQKIYDQGDDAIEFAYNDSPIFAQYWDEYEGDLDSIIAEVEPSELQIILDELEAAAEDQGVTEGAQVDSLVTDALKIMKGPELSHAVAALKTVLGDREYNSRRGFYNFYVKQIVNMYNKQDVAEGIEMDQDSASPIGSVPADTIPQVQHVTEDWGSSDWHPVMKGMWDVIDRHYGGRANPESIQDAAENAAEFYYDDMGYDSVEDAKDRIISMFLIRPDGIGRKRDKTPEQELEEAGVVPAPAVPASPEAAGLQGQLNVKQLASILPGIDARSLGMAIATLKTGNEPSMVQQKALAGAFAALIKADPQTTSKAMAVLKKVSAEPAPTPATAKTTTPNTPALGTQPAPAATKPVGTTAPAPAAPAEESMDYIKENKRKR